MPSRIILPTSGNGTSFLVPSNNLQLEANTERSVSGYYTVVKKFKIGTPGIILLEFEYRTTSSSAKIVFAQNNNDTFTGYGNNLQIDLPSSSSYTKISTYLPIYSNKYLTIFGYSNTQSNPLYVKNCKIYFDYYNDNSNAVITD